MNLSLILYLTELLSNFDGLLRLIIGLFFIVTLISSFFWVISNDGYSDEHHEIANKIMKFLYKKIWIIVTALIIQLIIPSKTTMYMMLGSSYLSNSNIPTQVNEILTLKLGDIIKDLKEDQKK